ncbi:MAG: 2,3-bisphosphoglycerate-independent phosphoglycerate mutase, partial [Lachnospiraceae bacterium]|nr:2,3-bisphosphoglycerate-independent phosphoglycerate mutase [Lachnospiraceae bacterium]
QDLTKISKSIADGDFFQIKELQDAIMNCKEHNSNLHLYGLLSDGGVHSDISHLFALLDFCKKNDFNRVFVHCFMDGRDTSPTSGIDYVQRLLDHMSEIGIGKIATIIGRYYAMDRDNRWERIERAYRALTQGEGILEIDPIEAVRKSYAREVTDEFIEPTVLMENENPVAVIKNNDSIIFYNFRPDRAREITRTFCEDEFHGFERDQRIKTFYVCFTEYDNTIKNKLVVFKEEEITNTFGKYISSKGLKQARIAETEKYAHVTFFFNGGIEAPEPGEDRFLIPSPKVATYDLQPEMSAPEVCETLIDKIKSRKYDCIIINFANPDMVGHTGVFEAVVKALEVVDDCVKKTVEAIKEVDGVMFLCADHGNSEELINLETGEPWTAHTTNPVPFVLINGPEGKILRKGGKLCDIAPTLLEILGLEKPEEMTGQSLLI